jgi:hypothetical protein
MNSLKKVAIVTAITAIIFLFAIPLFAGIFSVPTTANKVICGLGFVLSSWIVFNLLKKYKALGQGLNNPNTLNSAKTTINSTNPSKTGTKPLKPKQKVGKYEWQRFFVLRPRVLELVDGGRYFAFLTTIYRRLCTPIYAEPGDRWEYAITTQSRTNNKWSKCHVT